MRRRSFISLSSVALLLGGCSLRDRRQAQVYGAYLNVLAGRQPVPPNLEAWDQPPFVLDLPLHAPIRLVVESRVRPLSAHDWKSAEDVNKTLPRVQRSAALDLLRRQAIGELVQLPATLPSNVAVDLVDRQVLDQLFHSAGGMQERWGSFAERYPGRMGIASFSTAGFSADGQQAVFVFEHSCGSLCGTGNAVLMRRSAAGWALQEHRGLWVS